VKTIPNIKTRSVRRMQSFSILKLVVQLEPLDLRVNRPEFTCRGTWGRLQHGVQCNILNFARIMTKSGTQPLVVAMLTVPASSHCEAEWYVCSAFGLKLFLCFQVTKLFSFISLVMLAIH
jgi:hypothetical protein